MILRFAGIVDSFENLMKAVFLFPIKEGGHMNRKRECDYTG